MGAATSDDRIAQRLEELQQALQELSQVFDRSFVKRERRKPKLTFPFSLLQQLTWWGLDRLNRTVGQLVQRIIR